MASKSISKSVVWQLAGKFALQGLSFFTAPIFTRLLNPTDYGYTALYGSWISIFSLAIGLMTYGAIGNARIKYNDDEINGYLSSTLSISVVSFSIILFMGILFKDWLSEILEIRQDLVILAIFHSFSGYIVGFYINKLDNYKQVEKSSLISISHSILVIISSLIIVINTKGNKGIARIYSQTIPSFVYGIIFLIIIYRKGKVLWNKDYNKFCLSLSLPLLIHGIGGLIFSQSDRIMISKLQNGEILGIYSVTYSLCNILIIIQGALNISWVPFYMDFKKQNNISEILRHSKRYIKLFTILCSGFILLSYDVFKLLAPEKYWDGLKIIPILVLAFYFGYLYLFPVNFEFFNEKTKLIPLITIIAALINIAVNFVLIPKFGLIGAALGTLIAHFLEFFFHWIGACFIIKQKFEYNFFYFLIGTIVLIIFIIFSIFIQNIIWLRWLIAILLGIYLLYDIVKNKSIF